MKDKPLVYISGPYTIPEPISNTRKAMDAWNTLVEAGYIPIIPHATLFVNLVYEKSPDFWYEYDLHILARCDYLLRLPGYSRGADIEVKFALENNIPVVEGDARSFLMVMRLENEVST